MEIVIRGVSDQGAEQLLLRADTRTFDEATARRLEAAVASLTNRTIGRRYTFDEAGSHYELQIREQPGARPLTLTVVPDDPESPFGAVREIIRLIALASAAPGT